MPLSAGADRCCSAQKHRLERPEQPLTDQRWHQGANAADGGAFAYRSVLGGCDAKEYPDAEFRSRAHELLRQGHASLDGNGDGQVCEALC